MASIASIHQLTSQPQLPVAWYVDPQIYALEAKHLFPNAPNYLGHALMVPNVGDYHVLDWSGEAKSLIHNKDGISVMSNVCRHRQAIMLKGSGHTNNIVCPLHRWTYDLDGKLLGAPHFDENPCLHLHQKTLQNWQGLLFDSKRDIAKDLAKLGCTQDFDFTNYVFDGAKVEHYNFNWKTFIEAYLEDYHVGPFHPGLNQFVDCDDLHWDFGEHFSAQTVGFKPQTLKNNTPVYEKWHQTAIQYSGKQSPKHGAIWFAYYPFLMIEWYPHVLVVSHLIPNGTDQCTNVTEFYYPEDIALFEREFVAAHQAAYFETAVEDKEICQRMHDGRRALFSQGIDERGPYQHPMETGLEHFHRWYRHQLEAFI
jgi:phenylpropionate dioxygenase-like ring-hydroxylating dioxygenase large terminal subunit